MMEYKNYDIYEMVEYLKAFDNGQMVKKRFKSDAEFESEPGEVDGDWEIVKESNEFNFTDYDFVITD